MVGTRTETENQAMARMLRAAESAQDNGPMKMLEHLRVCSEAVSRELVRLTQENSDLKARNLELVKEVNMLAGENNATN